MRESELEGYLRGENVLLPPEPNAIATGYKRQNIGLGVHLGAVVVLLYFFNFYITDASSHL